MKIVLWICVRLIACFAVFNIAGVLVSFLFDLGPNGDGSIYLAYTVWVVLGILFGIFGYTFAGGAGGREGREWTSRPDARKIGLLVIGFSILLATPYCAVCYVTMWKIGGETNSYVPDNPNLTVVFFGAALAAMIFSHLVLRPRRRQDL